MAIMVKDSLKKVKKLRGKDLPEEEASKNEDHDMKASDNSATSPKMMLGKELRQNLLSENAYISDLLGIVNFPKKSESDDEDVILKDGKKRLSKGGAKNLQELRERLRAKMESLQAGRGEGKKDKKPKLSKEEKLLKKKEELRLQAKLAKMAVSKQQSNGLATNGVPKAKPVYDSNGKMVFSKFDFTNSNGQTEVTKKKKDPKAALQSIQKQKEKLNKLKEKGEVEKAKVVEEQSAWSKAIDKAGGAKIKDDVGLLKKSIKKQEQRKKSSAKKWDARKENEERRKEAKQHKRSENIGKRKQDKKDKKAKKLAKKGRFPGFQ